MNQGDGAPGGDGMTMGDGLDALADVYVLKEDLLRGLSNPKLRGKIFTLEAVISEIGAQLIQYTYSDIFTLAWLVRETAARARQNGFPNALERVLELWELNIDDDPSLAELKAERDHAKEFQKGGKGKKGGAKRSTKAPPTPERTSDADEEDAGTADASLWQVDRNGKIRPNEANAMVAIDRLRVKLSYDRFRRESQVDGLGGYGPALDEDCHAELYLAIQREFFFKVPAEDLKKMVRSAARRNSFDPIVDYLDSRRWDGVERLDEWLITYGGARDDVYVREVGAKMLTAAVRRARHPGCKFDYMPIFEGPERRGKSSAIKLLAGDDFFTDAIPIHSNDPRHTMEAMRGIWIAEYGELVGMQKAEVETIKAWLSRSTDTGAMKYDRESSRIPRRFIAVGTTNPQVNGFLTSTTGNQRFWPVVVDGFDLDNLARDREQLWAEAAWREARGDDLELSPAAKVIAFGEQAAREIQDAWDSIIDRYARAPDFALARSSGYVEGELYEYAWHCLEIPRGRLSKGEQMRVAEALRRAGFERMKRERTVIWRRQIW